MKIFDIVEYCEIEPKAVLTSGLLAVVGNNALDLVIKIGKSPV